MRLWSHQDGLPHPRVTSILEDQQGRLWVGTGFHNQGGAAIFEHRALSVWECKGVMEEGSDVLEMGLFHRCWGWQILKIGKKGIKSGFILLTD